MLLSTTRKHSRGQFWATQGSSTDVYLFPDGGLVMKLTFTLTERESLAMTEHFYSQSPSHQRMRNRTRWVMPAVSLPILFVFISQFGFDWVPVTVVVVATIVWTIRAPYRFDARIRRYALLQMREAAYAKAFGEYTLQINEDKLVADGPSGHSEYKWQAIDRAILTDEYLFIFLTGPFGLPIRVAEIGRDVAEQAHARIRQLIGMTS